MATSTPADHPPKSEAPPMDGSAEEQLPPTPDRRHVDVLLNISEEGFLKDLEPHEHHSNSGWEEAVRGWTRVAPLSSLFISPKRSKNRTTKRADSPSRQSVEPVLHNTDTPAKKPPETIPSSTPWSGTTAAPLVPAVSESPMFDAFWRNMPEMLPEESPKKKGSHKDSSAKSKLTKNLKSLPRSLNTVVPIKQFTFLPPIEELQLNPHLINEQILPQRISEGDSSEKSCFAMDKKGGTKGTRLDSVTNHEPGLYPKLHLAQCNSQLLSAFSVSIPGRYPVSVSSNQMQPSSLGRRTIYSSSGTNDVAPMYALSL